MNQLLRETDFLPHPSHRAVPEAAAWRRQSEEPPALSRPASGRLAGRCFLFLQGPPTGFWHRLATRLQAEGARVEKVTLCLADRLFWPKRGAVAYRGTLKFWPRWLAGFAAERGVTDLLYYADRQPYHRAAVALAEATGLRGWAMEFGYLRPDWLTLVEGRMGAENLPGDEIVRRMAADAEEPDWTPRYAHSFLEEAAAEVGFHLSNYLGALAFPGYRADRFHWPPLDYLAWLPEFWRERRYGPEARAVVRRFAEGGTPFYTVAMQLESDYQIRAASPFPRQIDMIRNIFASFAALADPKAHLVIKIHPLDNGLERWPARIARLAANFGLGARVHVIKGGDLDRLLARTKGVLLANSTVGLHAIRAGVPVLAFGEAVFNRKGLTHQGNLDQFWTGPDPVQPDFAAAFLKALGAIQLKGSFYDRTGQASAIAQAVTRFAGPEQAKDRAKQSRSLTEYKFRVGQ